MEDKQEHIGKNEQEGIHSINTGGNGVDGKKTYYHCVFIIQQFIHHVGGKISYGHEG
jgi:hypothetical protein